jgi:hypothetical protein
MCGPACTFWADSDLTPLSLQIAASKRQLVPLNDDI